LIEAVEPYITSSLLPQYIKSVLLKKMQTICETSKISNIVNGFLYSESAYECLTKIYHMIITNEKIEYDEIVKMFDKLLEVFSSYIISTINAINGIIRSINWLIMTIPKVQYIPTITIDYVKKIFIDKKDDDDNLKKDDGRQLSESDKINIEKESKLNLIILSLLKIHFDKIISQISMIIMSYINDKYLDNSLKYSRNVIENCYELIRACGRNPEIDLVITGHSLGGGITQYLSACYSNLGIPFNPVAANIIISDLKFGATESPVGTTIDLGYAVLDSYLSGFMGIKLKKSYDTQIVDFVPKKIKTDCITAECLIIKMYEYICELIKPIESPDILLKSCKFIDSAGPEIELVELKDTNSYHHTFAYAKNDNVINIVVSQDVIHQLKFSTEINNIHIGKLYILSEVTESSIISPLREAHSQYIMSYPYKTCIIDDDSNHADLKYIKLSVLIREIYNYAENVLSFHCMENLLLFMIRIMNKMFPDMLNVLPAINKTLLSEPLYIPLYHDVVKMYRYFQMAGITKD
jgi:hypothetical protein